MPHNTQCVCQICICERSGKSFTKGHFDVYIGHIINSIISERQHPQAGTFAENENMNVAHLHTAAKENPMNMYITSHVLRRHNYESLIVFGSDDENNHQQPKRSRQNTADFQKPSHRHTREYEDAFTDDNKCTIKVGQRRDRSAETHDNVGLILEPINIKSTKSGSRYNDDYKDENGSRQFDISKPFDSNFWKKKGKLAEETILRQDYDRKKDERYTIHRLQDCDIIQGDGIFIGENQTSDELMPKKGKRYEITRSQTSDLWKNNGSFTSETETGAEFTAKEGERYKAKRPAESELWKKEGRIDRDTVSHQDYTSKTGERYPVSKPQDSDILHGDGSFISETQTGTEFTAKKGERYKTKHPVESELWKVC
ncbi:unnamed protein product [Cercopithifilaria johnstoni]|uniref:Uncharacterized protein n=1 Tax=Cercopithifilaria johnstoni TaxID=2874296 RepID=A0A8J2M3Q3_9BILA|nr:unnamed protein product [Cercopithifilaria johnstoni]